MRSKFVPTPYPNNAEGNWFNQPNSKYRGAKIGVIPAFNLPALRTRPDNEGNYWSKRFQEGFLVCQMARGCTRGCYAQSGHYLFPSPMRKAHRCLDFTLHPNFVPTLAWELHNRWKSSRFVRIHTSGEFYSLPYLSSWLQICRLVPRKTFWAYTKMVRMVKALPKGAVPRNLILVFSEGGHEDRFIDPKRDRFSRVFPRGTPSRELKRQGFADGTEDDSQPICAKGARKIGLIMHGEGPDFFTGPTANPPEESGGIGIVTEPTE